MLKKIKTYWQRLILWQQTSPQIKEKNTTETVCLNCGETFASNFCPNCGQSRKMERITLKKALRIFLDTWGLSTHGMLFTIWQLIARPGYMIKDYLEGHRQNYFPPFKTLLVVGTAFAITFALAGGFNESAMQHRAAEMEELNKNVEGFDDDIPDTLQDEYEIAARKRINEVSKEDIRLINRFTEKYTEWSERNKVLHQMLLHTVFAFLACYIFRKSPRYPKMNLAENIIAQVYICAQMGFVATMIVIYEWLTQPHPTGTIPLGLSFAIFVYDFKQLYGFGLLRTIWKTLLTHLLFLALIIAFIILGVIIIGLHAGLSTIS